MKIDPANLVTLLTVWNSWSEFMQECGDTARIDAEIALKRHLETLDEEELRKLLDD